MNVGDKVRLHLDLDGPQHIHERIATVVYITPNATPYRPHTDDVVYVVVDGNYYNVWRHECRPLGGKVQ